MAKKTYQAPYDRNGNLMHYPETQWWYENDERHYAPPTWRDPAPFTARLTYQGYKRGRSAAYFQWVDENGRTFPMFLTDIDDILRTRELGPDGITATWVECKRGQNYGLRLASAEEADADA